MDDEGEYKLVVGLAPSLVRRRAGSGEPIDPLVPRWMPSTISCQPAPSHERDRATKRKIDPVILEGSCRMRCVIGSEGFTVSSLTISNIVGDVLMVCVPVAMDCQSIGSVRKSLLLLQLLPGVMPNLISLFRINVSMPRMILVPTRSGECTLVDKTPMACCELPLFFRSSRSIREARMMSVVIRSPTTIM